MLYPARLVRLAALCTCTFLPSALLSATAHAAPAAADTHDTDETDDTDDAKPAPAEEVPVRAARRFVLGGNAGLNSLGGLGVWAGYNITPHLAVDAGVGYGYLGGGVLQPRTGLQVRVNLLKSVCTPYVAVSGMYNWAFDNYTSRSVYVAPTVGLSVQAHNGFSLMAGMGYAFQVAGPGAGRDASSVFNHWVINGGIGYAF